MSLTDIDKQIEEYKRKLDAKSIRIRRGKRVSQGIPNHLRNYINQEIAKLEKQKEALANLKRYSVKISWDKVIFEDGQIRISLEKYYSKPFRVENSRKSFEFIKPYILKASLPLLSVLVEGDKIISINNVNQLYSVIRILSLKNEMRLYFENFETRSLKKMLSKLRRVSNTDLWDFFKLKQRSLYLKFLCDNQSQDYRIVPVTEITTSNDTTMSEEETFLFTINSLKGCSLIWESTQINRATYIFATNEITYATDIQRLFDFITSNEKHKRSKLRFSSKVDENLLNCIGTIEHRQIDSWIFDVKTLCGI